jgi:uncharacterized surface protein with fasciclin (FAS1) repeats
MLLWSFCPGGYNRYESIVRSVGRVAGAGHSRRRRTLAATTHTRGDDAHSRRRRTLAATTYFSAATTPALPVAAGASLAENEPARPGLCVPREPTTASTYLTSRVSKLCHLIASRRSQMTIDSTRRNVLKAVGSAGALLAVGGVGVAGAREGKRIGASGDKTIVDIAEDEGFSILVEAVEAAGLVDALSGNRQLTVFAPTNAAFVALLGELGVTKQQLLERSDLANILLYHVTPGRRYASSVLNAPRVRTLNGEFVHVDGTELNDGQANIDPELNDIEASNGVIHVIDGVLLPKA